MSEVTLEQSGRIIDAILARGRELGCRPLSVAVTDPGAHLKAFKKEDDSAMMRFEMAMGKAYAALALGRSSSLVRARNEEKPQFMSYLINASGGKIFPEGGGRLIRDERGEVIGAVGVTGDIETRDEELAAHGIRAAGLKTDEDCAHLGHPVRLKN
ncbi:MAG TPA: heme-binding protein [Burkholderiales bacterium]|nr:heme-binding protein [Burkholderiales bacterium]